MVMLNPQLAPAKPVVVHLDFEVRSLADLRDVGPYRYAADPSTEILLCAVSENFGEAYLWVNPRYAIRGVIESHPEALRILSNIAEPDVLVYAHNAPFEIPVARYRWVADIGTTPPRLEQWRCTMAMARRAALPQSLEKIAECLGLSERKDKEGSRLVRLLCLPQKRGADAGKLVDPTLYPSGMVAFGNYCLQDVRTEKEVHKKLAAFEMKGDTLRTWLLDMAVNDRGIPVNVAALRNAKRIIDSCRAEFGHHFTAITGLAPTQRDKILGWFKERGYPYEDTQAATVEQALEALGGTAPWSTDEDTRRAMELKKLLSYAAVAKVEAMLGCECGDGLVRGTLLYYGAGTGRWSARLIQPQNFKRPTIKDTDIAYRMICDGCSRDDLELVFGNPLEVIASCIRHFIQLPYGQMMFDADYAAIEARIVCWLADQEDALRRFRDGIDSYVDMATIIFNKDKSAVTKDERWMGKQTVLGCGFQMGAKKFFEQCYDLSTTFGIKGVNVTMELAEWSVAAFREKYDQVASLWYEADRAARNAILHPGKKFRAGSKLWFSVVTSAGIPFLVMKLPSGRNIVYPWPKLEPDVERPDRLNITFFGQLPMKQTWGRVKTYGGKLIENATQGTAADVMSNGAANALELGFDVITLIHDQALAAADERDPEAFCEALTTLPPWANGLPVKAEGGLVPYYLKG